MTDIKDMSLQEQFRNEMLAKLQRQGVNSSIVWGMSDYIKWLEVKASEGIEAIANIEKLPNEGIAIFKKADYLGGWYIRDLKTGMMKAGETIPDCIEQLIKDYQAKEEK